MSAPQSRGGAAALRELPAGRVARASRRGPLFASLLSAFSFLLFPGCTLTTYRSADGETFSRLAIGNQTQLQSLELTTQGRTLDLKGYQNDQSATAAAVTEAAVKAALSTK